MAIVNHKRVIYWVINNRKIKYVLENHDAWHGAMVWTHRALVKSWEGLNYVVMHALHKSNHHRGSYTLSRGKSPRLKGNPNFRPSLSFSFFPTINIPPPMQRLQLWNLTGSFAIFRGYVHFLGINAHNSNSNNRCMKRCTRTVWKTMLVLVSTFSCLLQGMVRYFKEMCGNSQP